VAARGTGRYRERGVSCGFDIQDTRRPPRRFVGRFGLTFPVGPDLKGTVSGNYGVWGPLYVLSLDSPGPDPRQSRGRRPPPNRPSARPSTGSVLRPRRNEPGSPFSIVVAYWPCWARPERAASAQNSKPGQRSKTVYENRRALRSSCAQTCRWPTLPRDGDPDSRDIRERLAAGESRRLPRYVVDTLRQIGPSWRATPRILSARLGSSPSSRVHCSGRRRRPRFRWGLDPSPARFSPIAVSLRRGDERAIRRDLESGSGSDRRAGRAAVLETPARVRAWPLLGVSGAAHVPSATARPAARARRGNKWPLRQSASSSSSTRAGRHVRIPNFAELRARYKARPRRS